MVTIVLEHIKGTDLPAEWIEKYRLPTERSFTVKIEPDTLDGLPPAPVGDERMRILESIRALGGGNEDSEEWIRIIKTARTISKRRVDII
ncbi:hypothetical protein [Candidatus Magnetomonas plexicatena]|uniref:hypothetical protein n=1 Tax=Candidatus Magnetomonas plexicatena TaxID=2552947 RepID=UPI001C745DC5|nr:hypothetical protein E2O03_006430 [Nitrospirales bacterium LBB_01]